MNNNNNNNNKNIRTPPENIINHVIASNEKYTIIPSPIHPNAQRLHMDDMFGQNFQRNQFHTNDPFIPMQYGATSYTFQETGHQRSFDDNNRTQYSHSESNQSNSKAHCRVNIISGKYDEVGGCWIDEGQKKIEILIDTNIKPISVVIYCDKESNNNRTKILSVSGNQFDFDNNTGNWYYKHKFVPNFPVKSGVTHSPLRFIAEVKSSDNILTFVGNEDFYIYSKLPEQVKSKKKREREDESTTPATPTNDANMDDMQYSLVQQQERLNNVEKQLQSLQNIPRLDETLLNQILTEITNIGVKQEEFHKNTMQELQALKRSFLELKQALEKQQKI